MKAHPLTYLLFAGLAVIGIGASAAEPDISGIGTWEKAPYTLKDPARKLYVAISKPLGYADGGPQASQYAYFDAWGKLVYDAPQRHGKTEVTEEWVALHLDCATMRYSAARYLSLDAKGTVLVDASFRDRPKRFHTYWIDPDYMRLAELTGDIAGRDACGYHSD